MTKNIGYERERERERESASIPSLNIIERESNWSLLLATLRERERQRESLNK